MLRAHAAMFSGAVFTVDILLGAAAFGLCFGLWGSAPALTGHWASILLVGLPASLGFPVAMALGGLYSSQRRAPMRSVLARLGVAGGLLTALLVATTIALGKPQWLQPAAVCGLLQLGVFSLERIAIHSGLHLLRRFGRNVRHALVVGTGPRACTYLDEVAVHPEWGIRIVGFVDDGDTPVDPRLAGALVHKLVDFRDLLGGQAIDEVVIALPRSLLEMARPVVAECAARGIPVTVFANLFGDCLPALRATRYGQLPMLQFAAVLHHPAAIAVKRVIDVIGSAALLALLAPLMAAVALAIRASSPGGVIFRQKRMGLRERHFECLKFRSMVEGAEQQRDELLARNEMDGPVFKLSDDPRVTPVGRFLRRWSIDELPQLWNVLRGDMSLVGPRPPLPEEVDRYSGGKRRRLSMRPGITCLWQINGRNEIPFEGWMELDLHYIDQWSLALDLWILLCTPVAVLGRRGAS
jgi:exopolysaccharide biosynthesis polyprenyl glycosylphosphotransferase